MNMVILDYVYISESEYLNASPYIESHNTQESKENIPEN